MISDHLGFLRRIWGYLCCHATSGGVVCRSMFQCMFTFADEADTIVGPRAFVIVEKCRGLQSCSDRACEQTRAYDYPPPLGTICRTCRTKWIVGAGPPSPGTLHELAYELFLSWIQPSTRVRGSHNMFPCTESSRANALLPRRGTSSLGLLARRGLVAPTVGVLSLWFQRIWGHAALAASKDACIPSATQTCGSRCRLVLTFACHGDSNLGKS